MHRPHAAPPANWAAFIATVTAVPFVQGRLSVLAKFSEKEQAPCVSPTPSML